jgi:truncated hemoglobin YjbI
MVLGAALCCAGCEKPVAAPSADASPSVGSAAVTAQLGSSPLPGNPADRLKALAMLHRVPADVRFLDAYRDVHLLLAGTPIERPTATFDGEWILRSGNVEVGRAPDIPDFSDLMKALIGYVRGLEAKGKLPAGLDATPVAGSSLDFPMDDEVDAMLTRAAASWPKRAGESLELATPFMPDDAAKLATLSPDPDLWEALGRGKLLRAILEDFYGRVYRDPRLLPFFHKVTIERAIDKQYAFLADVFTGRRDYFGLKPFNAHHWMVISDELFDYRERSIEDCMRRHGARREIHPAMVRRPRALPSRDRESHAPRARHRRRRARPREGHRRAHRGRDRLRRVRLRDA